MMPTAARMAGAVVFGILAWFVSELVKPLMEEGTSFGLFSQYNAIIGILCGWVIMGPRASGGNKEAIGGGLTTSIALMFWGLVIYSIVEMITLSMRMHYDGPVEAVVGIFQLAIEYGVMIATPEVIGTMIVGGMLGGMLCGWVARRWS